MWIHPRYEFALAEIDHPDPIVSVLGDQLVEIVEEHLGCLFIIIHEEYPSIIEVRVAGLGKILDWLLGIVSQSNYPVLQSITQRLAFFQEP